MQITVGNLFEGLEFHAVLESLDACPEALHFQGDKCIIDTIEAMQKVEAESSNPLMDLGVFWAWAVWLSLRFGRVFEGRKLRSELLMRDMAYDVLTLEKERLKAVGLLYEANTVLSYIPSQRIGRAVDLYKAVDDINQVVYSEGLSQVLHALKELILPAHRAEQTDGE